ncbi:MAG: hypothetical protein WC821_01660 [archaeon]|jgi:hypothetical protein
MVNAKVELVPWVHELGMEAHAEVINYIKTLPKNSVLCVEATQKDLAFNPNEGEFNALWDVVHECEKLNIKLIPIESPAVVERYHLNLLKNYYPAERQSLNDKSSLDESVYLKISKIRALREKAFVNNIRSALYTLKEPKLIVLVGASHINGVAEGLANQKISSNITLAPFKQKRLMLKILDHTHNLFTKNSSFQRLDKVNKLKRIMEVMTKRVEPIERSALIKKIIRRQYTAKKRIKTKLTRLRR